MIKFFSFIVNFVMSDNHWIFINIKEKSSNTTNLYLPSINTPSISNDWTVTSHRQHCISEDSRDIIWWKIIKKQNNISNHGLVIFLEWTTDQTRFICWRIVFILSFYSSLLTKRCTHLLYIQFIQIVSNRNLIIDYDICWKRNIFFSR